jgi:hypothetical protein
MTSARQFLKARWKFLLCLAVLLALVFCLVALLSAPRTPVQVFAIGTNAVEGVRWVQIVITNTTAREYSIHATKQIFLNRGWQEPSEDDIEVELTDMPPFPQWSNLKIGKRATRTFRFPLPAESTRWRLKFRGLPEAPEWERRIALWCWKAGFRYQVRGSFRHTIEFGQ